MKYSGRGGRGDRGGRGGRGGHGGQGGGHCDRGNSFLSPWYNQRGQNRRGSCGPAAPVPRLPRVIKEGNLSAKELRRIWKDEFLPSIRREIKTKILELKSSIKALTERCNAIEKSQDFVSKKYDTAIASLQSVKSQTANLDKKYQGVQFQFFPIF